MKMVSKASFPKVHEVIKRLQLYLSTAVFAVFIFFVNIYNMTRSKFQANTSIPKTAFEKGWALQNSHFKKIIEDYSSQPVDFLVVYIEEAHPTDGWSFEDNNYHIKQHEAIKDRLKAARMFIGDTKTTCPVLVDNFENEANQAYGALPERLYIIKDGVVKYQGGSGPMNYDLDEMESVLSKLLHSSEN